MFGVCCVGSYISDGLITRSEAFYRGCVSFYVLYKQEQLQGRDLILGFCAKERNVDKQHCSVSRCFHTPQVLPTSDLYLVKVCIMKMYLTMHQRPYHVENTGSPPITAVKQRWVGDQGPGVA